MRCGLCRLFSRTLTDRNRLHLLYINTTTTSEKMLPKEPLRYFSVLKKLRNNFDCLVHEVLFIRELKPILKCKATSLTQNYLYDFPSNRLCKFVFTFLFTCNNSDNNNNTTLHNLHSLFFVNLTMASVFIVSFFSVYEFHWPK